MNVKIQNKIVGYEVITPDKEMATKAEPAVPPASSGELAEVIQMHEKVMRPDMLIGSTYKIKTPVSEHAFYITINDMVLNPDTPYEKRRPFEIFINSKNMDHYQWISGLTLIISAVFRKGGDVTFLVNELQSVFDPKGGYFKKGGRFMPSLVAEIGDAIESHLRMIGMIREPEMDEHRQQFIEEKRHLFGVSQVGENRLDSASSGSFPATASLCSKCHVKAVVLMDGCMTCLNCGDSKCG